MLNVFGFLDEIVHEQSGLGGLGSLIAETAPGAVEGILFAVNGKYTEYHGNIALAVKVGYALGHTLAYIVEMRCAAADHTTKHHYGIIQTAVNKLGCCECQFDSPGDLEYIDHVGVESTFEYIEGAGKQGLGDMAVPQCAHNGHTHVAGTLERSERSVM